MADRVLPGPVDSSASISEAVCIHTKKIIDSCRDKDCIEDLRVFPYMSSQSYIDCACSIRPQCAELLHVTVDVDEICFNRGYYTVDVTFFYKVSGETVPGGADVHGIAVFSKRVMLYGGEGSAMIFSSEHHGATQSPTATVEVVSPITLNMKLVESCSCNGGTPECSSSVIPQEVIASIPEPLALGDASRLWYVTLGQFSIIRLERDTQIIIPMYDYCLPTKECIGANEDDPCTLFSRIDFPVDAFCPTDRGRDCPCQEEAALAASE